jgi:hypothetical protein
MPEQLLNGLTYTVEIAFPPLATIGTQFVLDDPVKGELDNTVFTLGGDLFIDFTNQVQFVSIERGRPRELDQFNAGTAVIELIDQQRLLDPNNADSPYFRGVKPRRRVRISVEGETIFAGWIIDWQFDTTLGQPLRVTGLCADAFQILANTDLEGYTPSGVQLANQRINEVLNDPAVAWPTADRDIGIAVTEVDDQAVTGSALSYFNLLAQAEQGYVFANRQGLLAFRGRDNVVTSTVRCRFGDDKDPASVPYRKFVVDFSANLLYNRFVMTPATGTAQVVNNVASQDEFLVSTLSFTGLPLSSDAQALTLAQLLEDRYAQPRTRVQQLETLIGASGPPWLDAVTLDLGDKVRVIKQFEPGSFWPVHEPFNDDVLLLTDSDDVLLTDGEVQLLTDFGVELDQELTVQSINHQITPSTHLIVVGLSPVYD